MAQENNATESLQLNLGSLRSAMSLTLHTHHASRIWHGRAPAEGRPGIIGLNGFVSIMNKLKRGAEQDDPYSDWWMLRIEDKGLADRMREFIDAHEDGSNRITPAEHKREATLWNHIRWNVSWFLVTVMDYNVSRGLNLGL